VFIDAAILVAPAESVTTRVSGVVPPTGPRRGRPALVTVRRERSVDTRGERHAAAPASMQIGPVPPRSHREGTSRRTCDRQRSGQSDPRGEADGAARRRTLPAIVRPPPFWTTAPVH